MHLLDDLLHHPRLIRDIHPRQIVTTQHIHRTDRRINLTPLERSRATVSVLKPHPQPIVVHHQPLKRSPQGPLV